MYYRRRDLLRLSAQAAGLMGVAQPFHALANAGDQSPNTPPKDVNTEPLARPFNGPYEGPYLSRVAFPLGGIGAGMVCLEGTGGFNHVSVRNQPELNRMPLMFAAVGVKGNKKVGR